MNGVNSKMENVEFWGVSDPLKAVHNSTSAINAVDMCCALPCEWFFKWRSLAPWTIACKRVFKRQIEIVNNTKYLEIQIDTLEGSWDVFSYVSRGICPLKHAKSFLPFTTLKCCYILVFLILMFIIGLCWYN